MIMILILSCDCTRVVCLVIFNYASSQFYLMFATYGMKINVTCLFIHICQYVLNLLAAFLEESDFFDGGVSAIVKEEADGSSNYQAELSSLFEQPKKVRIEIS